MKSPRGIWQIWASVTAMVFILSFTFQGFSIMHLPLLLGYSLLLPYFWMVTRSIENRILINEQAGKVNPETLAQRIHSYSHINSANSIGGNASLEGQEQRSPETEAILGNSYFSAFSSFLISLDASLRLATGVMGRVVAWNKWRPSSTLVPSSRTTIGRSFFFPFRASMTPCAT